MSGSNQPTKIWDIGHSTRSEDEFLGLLKKHEIEILADVRRFPSSKKFPHFNRPNLENVLLKNGIDYVWLGEELGGFRKGGYESWTKTEEFARGTEKLEKLAAKKATAFMCAEGDPRRCHRRFIIKALEIRGWSVGHIPSQTRSRKSRNLALFETLNGSG